MKDIFLLDMDDTLLDFERAERRNFFDTLSAFGISADERLYARFHAINDSLWKALERGEMDRERLKSRRFELLFEECGLAVDAADANTNADVGTTANAKTNTDAAEVSRAYFDHFAEVCFPFAGAREFLAALKARGRVFIVTNGGTVIQKSHIRLAGFAPYLDGVFISEEIGADKPSLAFADFVEAHIAGYRREHAVWIGDSPTSDGACARARGIDFVPFVVDGDPAAVYARLIEMIDNM